VVYRRRQKFPRQGSVFLSGRRLEAVWASVGVICPEKHCGEGYKWELNANKFGPEVRFSTSIRMRRVASVPHALTWWYTPIGARIELPIVLWSKSWATSLEHDIIVVKVGGYWMQWGMRIAFSCIIELGPPFMWRSFMFSLDTFAGHLLWPSSPFLWDLNNIPRFLFQLWISHI